MPSWLPSSWIFWLVGAMLALPGFWWLYRALWSDRSRGRRRCPRCWYGMDGVASLTCPECGRTARAERRLHKTRRRWRRAVASLLLLAIASVTAFFPQLAKVNWAHHAPTTALILALPYATPKRLDPVSSELNERLGVMEWWISFDMTTGSDLPDEKEPSKHRPTGLWRWQSRMLATRAAGLIQATNSAATIAYASDLLERMGPEAAAATPALRRTLPTLGNNDQERVMRVLGAIGPGAAEAAPDLAEIVRGAWSYDSRADSAAAALGRIGPAAAPASVDALRKVLDTPGHWLKHEALAALGQMGPAAGAARASLVNIVRNGMDYEVSHAVWALGEIGPDTDDARRAIAERVFDESSGTRDLAARIARKSPLVLDATIPLLRQACTSDGPEGLTRAEWRIRAAQGMSALGSAASPCLPELLTLLNDDDPMVRYAAVMAARHVCAGSPDASSSPVPAPENAARIEAAILERLRSMASDPDEAVRAEAVHAARGIKPQSRM